MAKVPKGGSGVKLRGTTGLLDNVTAKIGDVSFGTDSRYQGGKQLCAIVELVNPETGDELENGTLLLSVGNGWEDSDKGKSMVRADGSEPQGINDQTMFQHFINKALDTEAADVIEERFNSGIMPYHAGLLEGLVFRMERETYTPMQWDESKGEKPTRLVPVEYVGEGGGKAKAGKKDKKKGPATDD